MAWAIRQEGDRVGGRVRVQEQTVKGNDPHGGQRENFKTAEKKSDLPMFKIPFSN